MTKNNVTPLPVRIVSDSPASESLIFGFDGYVDTLSGLVAGKDNVTPFTVGIFGHWGGGKTTLMKAIKAKLDSDALCDARHYRRCKTVWFQPWKYNTQEEILSAMIEAIFKAMAADGFFSLARAKIDTVAKRFDKATIYSSISRLVAGVDVSEFFSSLDYKEKLGSIETFQKFFGDLVWTFLNWRFKLSDQEKPDDKMGAMVIFIDDLDRCPPGRIIQVLETIKLYMDRCGFIFVLGACAENIRKALIKDYGPQNARGFIDKIIQVRFTLPRFFPEEFSDLIEEANYNTGNARELKAHLPMIMPALGHNPRQFKRFINSLNLLNALLGNMNVRLGFDKVLAWGVIAYVFRDLADDIEENPDLLFALRKQIEQLSKKFGQIPVWQLNREQLSAENVPEFMHSHLQNPNLAEIVMRVDITADQLCWLKTLSGSVFPPTHDR
jgi:iron(II)-dependent oxidoreductase